jgi:hypothetical protein
VIASHDLANNADDVLKRDIDPGIRSLVEYVRDQPLTHEVDPELGNRCRRPLSRRRRCRLTTRAEGADPALSPQVFHGEQA